MENGAIAAANLNEIVGIGPLNSQPAAFRQDTEAENENLPVENRENDVVELSPESLLLARENAAENPLVETDEEFALTAAENQEVGVVTSTAEAPETVAEDTLANETNPIVETGGEFETNLAVETETAAAGVNTPAAVESTAGVEENQLAQQPITATEEQIVTELEAERAAAEIPPTPTVPPVSPQTAEGAVVREPEFSPETAVETPEVQEEIPADETARANEALNRENQVPGGTNPENSELSPETSRNEQQILLQNVGSQLAQVVPNASIISVLG
jgi:hypothetical protein